MKPIRTLALAAAVSALATGAYASTVDLKFNSTVTTQNMKIWGDAVLGGTTEPSNNNANVSAFNMTGSTPVGDVPSSVIGAFIAYCLDVSTALNRSATLTYNVNPDPVFSFNLVDTAAVQRYFDANFVETIPSDMTMSAAFQIGLWSTIYTAAQFTYAPLDNDFKKLVDDFVTAGETYNGNRIWTLAFLEAPKNGDKQLSQSLVTATPIPLPATGLLMLSVMGLGGIGVMARRRRDKAA